MIWLLATLVIFYSARAIAVRLKNPLINPLLISLLVLIPLLIWLKVPYDTYFGQNKIINYLLGPAVVALAYPLYEQLEQIKLKWKTIFTVCLIGSSLSMFIIFGSNPYCMCINLIISMIFIADSCLVLHCYVINNFKRLFVTLHFWANY